jgi:hypothetical protein
MSHRFLAAVFILILPWAYSGIFQKLPAMWCHSQLDTGASLRI